MRFRTFFSFFYLPIFNANWYDFFIKVLDRTTNYVLVFFLDFCLTIRQIMCLGRRSVSTLTVLGRIIRYQCFQPIFFVKSAAIFSGWRISNFSILFTKEDLRSEEEHMRSYFADFSRIFIEDETSTTRVVLFFKKKFLHVSFAREWTSMMVFPMRSPADYFSPLKFFSQLSFSLFWVIGGKSSRPL